MQDAGQEPGFGQLHPELLEALTRSGHGVRLASEVGQVAQQYGVTMLWAQILEFATKLAEPALDGPTEDDASRRHVEDRRAGTLNNGIRALSDASREEPSSGRRALTEALHDARRRRNELAHDFWWSAFPAMMASQTDTVLRRLTEDQILFTTLVERLFDVALIPGVERRDIHLADFAKAASILAAGLVYRPDDFEGVDLLADADLLVDWFQGLLAEDDWG